jgi:hypothetical protein
MAISIDHGKGFEFAAMEPRYERSSLVVESLIFACLGGDGEVQEESFPVFIIRSRMDGMV